MADDEELVSEGEQSTDIVKQAVDYDPVDHLSGDQIQVALRMSMFPSHTNKEIAEACRLTPHTISAYKKDPHFIEFLKVRRREIVQKTVDVRAERNAVVYDKLTNELMERFEKPKTDKADLELILGPDYSFREKEMYDQRFIRNMHAKDLMRVWGQVEANVREDSAEQRAVEGEETLIMRMQQSYEVLTIRRRKLKQFQTESGFDYNVNIHDEDAGEIFEQRKKVFEGDRNETIDVEFEDTDQSTEDAEPGDLLSAFNME